MANLGTKRGTIINPTQSLKIAGNPEDMAPGATASNYLGWGSFSGADCKVIVHYPIDHRMRKLLYEDQLTYEDQLNNINRQIAAYDAAPLTADTLMAKIRAEEQREVVQNSLSLIDSEITTMKNIPTSKVIGELQTISYSVYREKSPVRTLGSVYPRAYVRGPRTIGGSMIFTVFQQHVLHEILSLNLKFYNTGTTDHDKYIYTTNLPDQLPPLDISLVFANEYGALSHMGLYGVEFVQEGTTYSIEDIFSENVVQYVARDMDPLTIVDKRTVGKQGVQDEWTSTASSLLREQQYRNNHLYRRNQFI